VSGTLAPFRHRIFAAVWLASFFNNFGALVQLMAAAWLMTRLSDEPGMVALVQTAASAPVFILAPLAGAAADRLDRRRQMLAAQVLALGLGLATAGLAYSGNLGAWALLAATLAYGVSQAVHLPAWQSSIGDMVSREAVPAAVALNAVSYNSCRALGPAVGGILLIHWGAPAAFLFYAATTVGITAVLLAWRRPAPPRVNRGEAFLTSVRIGFAHAAYETRIRATLIRTLFFSFFAASAYALLPVIGKAGGDGAKGYAALLTAFGLGAIVAAGVSVRLRARFGAVRLSAAGSTATALVLIVVGWGSGEAVTLVAMAVFGGAWVMNFSIFNGSVQLLAPPWLVGRLVAVYQMCVFAGLALGSAFWGWAAGALGLGPALAAAGLAMLAGLLALRGRAQMAVEAAAPAAWRAYTPPSPAVPIARDEGPIVFEIGYEVPAEATRDFIAAVRALGAIRRVEGVRRWRLRRDLDAPTRWVESFWVSNWAEQEGRALHLTDESEAARAQVARFAPAHPRRVHRYLVIPDRREVAA
jgi:MFS family permease